MVSNSGGGKKLREMAPLHQERLFRHELLAKLMRFAHA